MARTFGPAGNRSTQADRGVRGLRTRAASITITGDLNIDMRFTRVAAPLQSPTVVAEVSDGDILNPDPGQRFFIRDEMLDGNWAGPVRRSPSGTAC